MTAFIERRVAQMDSIGATFRICGPHTDGIEYKVSTVELAGKRYTRVIVDDSFVHHLDGDVDTETAWRHVHTLERLGDRDP